MVTAEATPDAHDTLANSVDTLLRCPICRSELASLGSLWQCESGDCGEMFPSVDGVPILLNERNSVFHKSVFLGKGETFFKSRGRLRSLVSGWLPTTECNVAATRVLGHLRDLLVAETEHPTVLVLGGGVLGVGMEALANDARISLVETDVSLAPRTQLICDAHDLPLRDASFDAVIVQATLEHVVDPHRCVAEIERVLKPGGFVYSDTPFMQQVHGREYDFTRYTLLGHRRLFRNFAELESGISVGPGSALAWSLRYFLLSFCAAPAARRMVSGLSRLAFGWLKYFDYLLATRPSALDAAAAFYFLGRKSSEPLSDHELLAAYRGGF